MLLIGQLQSIALQFRFDLRNYNSCNLDSNAMKSIIIEYDVFLLINFDYCINIFDINENKKLSKGFSS